MRLSYLRPDASASPAALGYPEYLLRVVERRERTLGDPDVVLLFTSAHVSASLQYTFLQVPETTQACYVDDERLASVAGEVSEALHYQVELHSILTAGTPLPDYRTRLKKSFAVMLSRNLDPAPGLVYGARYVLEDASTNLFKFRLATGTQKDHRLCLSRMPYGPGGDDYFVLVFTVVQVPARTSSAISADKFQ